MREGKELNAIEEGAMEKGFWFLNISMEDSLI